MMANTNAIDQVTLEDALEIAKSHHQKNNLTLAERTYIDILNVYPQNFNSLHYLSILCYQQGKPDVGIEYAQKALEIEPTNPETLNIYGVNLSAIEEFEASIPQFQKAIEHKKDYVDAHNNLSHSLWQVKNYTEAEKHAHKAITINPDFADGYINLGAAYVAQDKIKDAIKAWKKAMELRPDHPNAHINLGNASREIGKIQEAEKYCLRALELLPESPEANMNYANILRDLDNLEDAEFYYRKAISIKPNYIDAHNNLALLYLHQKKFEDAATSARFANVFDKTNILSLNALSTALRNLGKIKESEVITRRALHIEPDSIEAKLDLADILLLTDKLPEAETLFKDVIDNFSDQDKNEQTRLYLKLSYVMERANKTEDALNAADKAIGLNPEMPEAYHRKAQIYFLTNQLEEALKLIHAGLEINPNAAMLLGTKSEILQSQGDMEESLKIARKGLALEDGYCTPSLYFTLSKVKKFTEGDIDILKMESFLKNNKFLDITAKSTMHFALYKAYQDIKNNDRAFQHLKLANDLKRQIVVHDKELETTYFEKIKENFTLPKIKAYEGKGYKSDVPVFIVGMPRSGTTLTEQIIASHPDVYGAGELYTISVLDDMYKTVTRDNCEEYGKFYVDSVQAISPEAKKAKRVTDKMPGNYMRLGQIAVALPDAKIIHCKRNPVDTCLSCYKQTFTLGHYWSYNLDDMADHYAHYYALMNHWREVIPDRFIEISYEDTVNDLETQARRLIDYVGLEWNDACLKPHKSKRSILTASKGQVRKPVYKTSVEAWRRYEDQLSDFAKKLEPFMDK